MCAGTGVGMRTSEKRFPERYAVCTSEESNEAVSTPEVKPDSRTNSEKWVSEKSG